MFSLGKRKASLRALRRKVSVPALPQVQPVVLLQMLIGLSQILNGAAAKPEALARALILDGQRRLRKLRETAPHVDLSLIHLLDKIRSSEMVDEHLSDEEGAIHAMVEMCLGLLLRWLSKGDGPSYTQASSVRMKPLPSPDVVFYSRFSYFHLLFRARSCLIS